jgi:hypothetical protein
MWKGVLLALLLAITQPDLPGEVEVFDSDQEKVVETYRNSQAFQEEAHRILDSATGPVQELSPSLEKVRIVKIPLTPPYRIPKAAWHNETTVNELFVVIPKAGGRKPWLIVHTRQNDSLFLEMKRGADPLQNLLKRS